jgi:hypothetical protein
VSEWSNEQAWKVCILARVSWVRIPPSPQISLKAAKLILLLFVFSWFTSTTNLVFNTDGKHYLELEDVAGRIIETIECTGKQYVLVRNGLVSGIYFIKAYNERRQFIAISKINSQLSPSHFESAPLFPKLLYTNKPLKVGYSNQRSTLVLRKGGK